MTLHTATEARLVLDHQSRAFLDAIEANPHAPMSVGIHAPGGYGKSVILRELARIYRRAGVTVINDWRDGLETADENCVLLVDDAHQLDEARLKELRHLVELRRHRLAIAYRPWPRPSILAELSEALKRDRAPLVLCPFTEEQTGTYLRLAHGAEPDPSMVTFVHAQTGGVPRFVDRLVRVLGTDPGGLPTETPQAAVIQFGADLDDLDDDVRRLLLAAATEVDLPVHLLSTLLSMDPDAVDEIVRAARATGLLGPGDRLPPIARRAVAALSPTTHRIAVWQRLAELQTQRGASVLPLARALLGAGAADASLAAVYETAGDEALTEEPALAAELFAIASAAGRPTTARQAVAAALAGDLDSALRLSDRLIAAQSSPERADGAAVAAVALTHRGQIGRSAELYRWSGTASSIAFSTIGYTATGHPEEFDRLLQSRPADGPPTLLASAALLMARGVRETLSGSPTTALSALVQASALLEPAGRAALLPDSPAALAALVALHSGEFDIAERVLDRAVTVRMGGVLMVRRHRLLQAWIQMVRGRTAVAAQMLASVTSGGRPLESRDLLFATALEMGIARRDSDLTALQRGWGHAHDAVVRHPVDLFTLLPLGEFVIAAARLGELSALMPYLRDARLLLERLGNPKLWATPLHWSALHAAIIAEEPTAVDDHVRILTAAAGHTRYGSVVAAAAESWVEVLHGVVDPEPVEAAARGLHGAGLSWDGARLAGQAAIRTSDRRAMTALLDCARMLQGRPTGPRATVQPAESAAAADTVTAPNEGRLSDREQEVADLVLAGMTYKQIGDRLFISAKTVEHHVARMRQRLNCSSRSELLATLRAMAAARTGGGSATVPWPRQPSR
ncbi:LuxR C-terminal-related transcriptional regulator [Planosporangium mesophilum]|uniref:Helix-turn-helix transcriptional regulator n=1 Tax=Planosporangium mesophilum TaxID=689768 RepID=A0A8J3THM8_9ACTN|nr:LuxR C-terminal-related transcriptional regulator [Planosporangium mesophilum]GII24869.1 helix-turn-helix transcriptional regulator [Planosporangium mesophilum]